MKCLAWSSIGLVLIMAVGCNKEQQGASKSDDSCGPMSNYTALERKPVGNHCQLTWYVDDTSLESPHPEVGVFASKGDEVIFKNRNAGSPKFIYVAVPNPPGQSGCLLTPFKDNSASSPAVMHNPGKLHKTGVNDCHYKLLFGPGEDDMATSTASQETKDPHIKVGN